MTDGPTTLAIDVGGSGLKAVVLAPDGEMLSERARLDTPYPCTPAVLLDELAELAATQPEHDRVSVGFPGAVRRGHVRHVTAFLRPAPGADPDPELRKQWFGWDIESALAKRFGKPVRVANDADVQGLAVIAGKGVEMVITLGTGFGTGLYQDGRLAPHLELSHHAFRKGETYDEHLGNAARKRVGNARWNKRVRRAIRSLRALTTFDHLYIGGGNAKKIDFELDPDVTVVSNDAGIRGGIALWQD